HALELHLAELVPGHDVLGRLRDRLPLLAVAVEQPPRLWQLAPAPRRVVEPVHLRRCDRHRLFEVVLDPLDGALSRPPGEPVDLVVVRVLRQEVVAEGIDGVGLPAVRSAREVFWLGWRRPVLAFAVVDAREGGDAEAATAHGDEGYLFYLLVALEGSRRD